jgi:hypothetical protein
VERPANCWTPHISPSSSRTEVRCAVRRPRVAATRSGSTCRLRDAKRGVRRVWIRLEGRGLILESSLEMARKLGITSVAEGAETQDDWNLLRECGCDLAQGFFIARPMETAVSPDWVREWHERADALTKNPPDWRVFRIHLHQARPAGRRTPRSTHEFVMGTGCGSCPCLQWSGRIANFQHRPRGCPYSPRCWSRPMRVASTT